VGAGETKEARKYRARMLALQREKQLRGNNIYFEGGEWFKRCLVCQQTFYSPAKQRRYCSDECRRTTEAQVDAIDSWMRNLAIAVCNTPGCENEFKPKTKSHRFCSTKCRLKFHNSFRTLTPARTCQSCGSQIEQQISSAKFCSTKCRVRAHRHTSKD